MLSSRTDQLDDLVFEELTDHCQAGAHGQGQQPMLHSSG